MTQIATGPPPQAPPQAPPQTQQKLPEVTSDLPVTYYTASGPKTKTFGELTAADERISALSTQLGVDLNDPKNVEQLTVLKQAMLDNNQTAIRRLMDSVYKPEQPAPVDPVIQEMRDKYAKLEEGLSRITPLMDRLSYEASTAQVHQTIQSAKTAFPLVAASPTGSEEVRSRRESFRSALDANPSYKAFAEQQALQNRMTLDHFLTLNAATAVEQQYRTLQQAWGGGQPLQRPSAPGQPPAYVNDQNAPRPSGFDEVMPGGGRVTPPAYAFQNGQFVDTRFAPPPQGPPPANPVQLPTGGTMPMNTGPALTPGFAPGDLMAQMSARANAAKGVL